MAKYQNSKNWTLKTTKDNSGNKFNQPKQTTEPLMIKSPYNFVPAPEADKVLTPDWADKVLHDMPLSEDALSGEISYTIEAKSPIFIRNGHSKKDHEVFEKWRDNKDKKDFSLTEDEKKDLDRYLSFSNYNDKYFIPATSIKGMLRNVLEIMSFSRLNPNLVNDDRYGYRDLSNGSDYMKNYKSPAVKAGWLSKSENGKWQIIPCDFVHIHHLEVDKALSLNEKGFRELFFQKNPIDKTAKYKYIYVCKVKNNGDDIYKKEKSDLEILQDYKSLISKKVLKFAHHTITTTINGKTISKKVAIFDMEHGKLGAIVFTGQSSKRNEPEGKKPSGKVHEFVFFETDGKDNPINVHEKLKKDFLFLYKDGISNEESIDWAFWKTNLKQGEKVPIFYTMEGDQLKHFGLSFMYKLPYEKSIHETHPISGYAKKPETKNDFASLLFGDSSEGLKGRVSIGHAFSKKQYKTDENLKLILGGPKASFFPFYLDQPENITNYTTYNSSNATLRGFKKYPAQLQDINKTNGNLKTYSEDQLKNSKIFSYARPLPKDTEFNGKIRFHNLKPQEVGALISALTLHLNENLYHNIGGLKPFGFGRIVFKFDEKTLEAYKKYVGQFETMMNEHTNRWQKKWIETPQVIELFSMAKGKEGLEFDYPFLEMQNNDQFKQIKTHRQKLDSFSLKFDSNLKFESKQFLDEDYAERFRIAQEEAFQNQEDLDLDHHLKISDLSKFLNKNYNQFGNFNELNKNRIIEAIKRIFRDNRESKRELSEPTKYVWTTNIPKWIGQSGAQNLFNELTNPKP